MMQRMNDGWSVLELSPDRLTMRHLVSPPAWRIVLAAINPVEWIAGPMWPEVHRVLHVWPDKEGNLHRRTTGDIPPRWPQTHDWDIEDGPLPARA